MALAIEERSSCSLPTTAARLASAQGPRRAETQYTGESQGLDVQTHSTQVSLKELDVQTHSTQVSLNSLVPSRTREKYVWQNLCTILGLSDVAILDSGWPIKPLLVTFSDV